VKELLKMSQNNYPYLTDHTFFVNTPWMFSVVWAVLKTVLSRHTLSKSHILTSAYHDALISCIDPSNLPPDFRPDCAGRSGDGVAEVPAEAVAASELAAASPKAVAAHAAANPFAGGGAGSGAGSGRGGSASGGSASGGSASGGSASGAAGRWASPSKKTNSRFGVSRSREASREAAPAQVTSFFAALSEPVAPSK
jgi:uncharacterized membrane protein YgcG